MADPEITRNELEASTVTPGGSTVWHTEARDPDSSTAGITRVVHDAAGGSTVFDSDLIVSDPLTYEAPTSDDPRLSFEVDQADPTKVTIHVAAA